ncbi:MAG TPA: polysaccharide biosynthesis tyrosine autokinase [Gemmatimonadaceae bacterium]|nr:polysaccharide biosynthesis tyrosine autokinase [Gemmatimonadaceae bacterium]
MSGQLVPQPRRNAPVEAEHAQLPQHASHAWPEPAAGPPPSTQSPPFQWRRYVDAVRRHRWLVLALVFVGIGAGWAASRFVKPKYEVHTTIWIPAEDRANDAANVPGGRVLDAAGWADLMTSFAVLDKVVAQMGLVASARDTSQQSALAGFRPSDALVPGKYTLTLANGRYTLTPEKGSPESGAIGDSIGRKFGFEWAPTARQIGTRGQMEFSVAAVRQASAWLRQRLTVQLSDSNFIIAKLRGAQPDRDAAVLNTLAREVVATGTELKRHNNTEVAQNLQQEFNEVSGSLKSSEDALARFRTSAITQPSEQSITDAMRDPTAAQYFASSAARDSLKNDREALERVISDAKRGPINVGALLSIPSARSAPELSAAVSELNKADSSYQALRRQFTDDYRPVKDLQAQMTRLRSQTIPQIASGILSRLQTSQGQFATRAFDAQRKLQAIPERALEEARLRRDVQTKENLYTTLKGKLDNSHMAEQSTVAEARVLDVADAATLPVANTRPYILAVSVLFALVLGIGAALVLDRFDPKLRYPEQVGELGLSLLAAVPHMNASTEIDHSAEEAAQAVEAFRALRLNLRHQQPGAGAVQLTVTSPGASEGKSLLAANLALSFAEAGYRTLLIDGDIRRGRQHETFGAANEPGLTDFLAGHARADEIARRSTHANLLVIPSGSRVNSGPELLMSNELPRLLAAVRPLFNAIIVDSAPLGAGADALALGAATGNVMLVLRAGATERRMAESRLSLLRRAPVRILGAVLNDIGATAVYDEYSYIEGYYVPMATEPSTETMPIAVQVQTQGD